MIITEKFHSLNEYKNMHLAPNCLFDYRKDYFFWDLEAPVKLQEPIKYKPPTGAVVWSKYEFKEDLEQRVSN